MATANNSATRVRSLISRHTFRDRSARVRSPGSKASGRRLCRKTQSGKMFTALSLPPGLDELRRQRSSSSPGGQDGRPDSEAAADCKQLWNACPCDARSFQKEGGDTETPCLAELSDLQAKSGVGSQARPAIFNTRNCPPRILPRKLR